MEYSIVQLTEKDWPQVSDIYLKGILTKTATLRQNVRIGINGK